jgi:hypothetical protein
MGKAILIRKTGKVTDIDGARPFSGRLVPGGAGEFPILAFLLSL